MNKRIKTKIGVRSVVKGKVRDIEENTREGRSRGEMKYVVGHVQYLVGRKKLLFQFKYGKKKEMSCVSLSYVCSKEEVCLEMYEPISNLPQKEQGVFLTIYRDPVVV